MDSKSYIVDIETDGLLNELTQVFCIVMKDEDTGEILTFHGSAISEALKLMEEADQLIFHNGIDFDIPALEKLYPEFKPCINIVDTLVASRVIWTNIKERDAKYGWSFSAPHSLSAWGQRFKFPKGDHKDFSRFTPEMLDYCIRDVEITHKLYELIMSKKYSETCLGIEMQFRKIIAKLEQRGVRLDVNNAIHLYGKFATERDRLTKQLTDDIPPAVEVMKTPEYWSANINGHNWQHETKGGLIEILKIHGYYSSKLEYVKGPYKKKITPFNPASTQQIAEFFKTKYNWKPELTEKGNPIVTRDTLAELEYPEAKILKQISLLNKVLGFISEGNQAWLKLEKDGIIYGRINTNGTYTGRCTHNSPNRS